MHIKILAVLLLILALSGCVSSGDDSRVAEQVADYLSATRVVPADTREADRTHNGRIVYMGLGRNGNPHFTYYEVTSAKDIALLESAAHVAVERVPGAHTVTLHFMERQVFHSNANGGGIRGHENELRRVIARRRAAP